MSNQIKIALSGNPNCGKTTVFNMLTGTRQKVANYPGVTVEKKVGKCLYSDTRIEVTDLPGTYCLSAYSEEELVARNFILNDKPDVVVDVIDASNIERNLYLAVQLIEMKVPVVLVFNMIDVAKKKGLLFDIPQLEKLLGVRIVETVASREQGKEELLETITEVAREKTPNLTHISYGSEINEEIRKTEKLLEQVKSPLTDQYPKSWLALKLIENDKEILAKCQNQQIKEQVKASTDHLTQIFADHPEIVIADRRYGFISGACQETIKSTIEARHDFSDKVDSVLTHKILGLPLFVGLMYLVFNLVFVVGNWPVMLLEHFFAFLGDSVTKFWPGSGDSLLLSLIVDGIIGGVGGVISFLPNILVLFLAIAILEDTGYMARAAFIMDRIMHRIGLHGKSFIPMLIGFGCSVPAIMATRILENKRNRLTTIMVTPLMSCGARFPIYALLIPAFFRPAYQGPMLWLIYFIGIIIAIALAKILRLSIFKGESVPFVMELPPYRIPTFKGLVIHTWDRGYEYLKKAGTIILALSIILWAGSTFPQSEITNTENPTQLELDRVQLTNSFIGRIGQTIEPAIKPLGFDWKIGTALIGAVGAKEVFVSQMGIVYSIRDTEASVDSLQKRLASDYAPVQGFCVMLFCLVSAPCIATLAVTAKETQSWFWGIFQWLLLTGLAYILTLVVYQIANLFNIANTIKV